MPDDDCLVAVRRLERIIDQIPVGTASFQSAVTTELEDLVCSIKLVKSKILSCQALRQYEQNLESLESAEVEWLEELPQQIAKAISIQKAKELEYISKYIILCIGSNSLVHHLKKRSLLEMQEVLLRYHNKMIKLIIKEMSICFETRKAVLEMQKELTEYKKIFQEKLCEKESTRHDERTHRKIEKINRMRKLMIAIMVTKDLSTEDDRWHQLFITLRDPVTIETFND